MISPKICHCIQPLFRNYAPVSTPSFYCIRYSVIKDTVSLYFTKYTMCIGESILIFLWQDLFLSSHLSMAGPTPLIIRTDIELLRFSVHWLPLGDQKVFLHYSSIFILQWSWVYDKSDAVRKLFLDDAILHLQCHWLLFQGSVSFLSTILDFKYKITRDGKTRRLCGTVFANF